jgi:diguanylate cyclase (GGDEF)-like protein/PAS domain S-box-containing protein
VLFEIELATDRIVGIVGDAHAWLSMDHGSLLGASIRDLMVASDPAPSPLIDELPVGASRHLQLLSGTGEEVAVELHMLTLVNDGRHALLVVRDRTAYIEQQETLVRFKTIVEQTADAVMITDERGTVQYVNPAFEAYTGYTFGDIVGRTAAILKSGHHDREFYFGLWSTLYRGEPFRALFVNRARSGKILHEQKTITPVRGKDGVIRHFVSTAKDVTERVEYEAHLAYLATHDTLTGLPNRKLFFDRTNQAALRARREGSKFALVYLDLDGFKAINDTFGHEAGDALLTGMASRIRHVLREADTVARLGGDEFCILLEGLGDALASEAIAAKVLDALRTPVLHAGQSLYVRASLGIAIYPDDHLDPQRLLSLADSAMYAAKRIGGCHVRWSAQDEGGQTGGAPDETRGSPELERTGNAPPAGPEEPNHGPH